MIQLFVTGGTLDKDYNTLTGELEFTQTHLPSMLKQANITLDITIQTLMLKDSLEMDNADRDLILNACIKSESNFIVITHGTDTMPLTAQYLADHFTQDNTAKHKKTIVLTGAMRPHCLGNSDALFNLGSAFISVKTTWPGVYIAMNGQLHSAQQVIKDTENGVFINTSTPS